MTVRVLFCRSNAVAPDPRVEKAARALQRHGYSVHILAWDRSTAWPRQETRDGLPIERIALAAAFGQGLRNLPALTRWQAALTRWLWRHRREFDVIHACDFDTVLPALLCKRWCGHRVVYDIFDFYAAHVRAPRPLKALLQRIEWWAVRQANATIIVDESRRHQLRGAQPQHLTVIYNTPEDRRQALPSPPPSPPGALRLAYIGALMAGRGLPMLLRILRRHPAWHLDLAGFGSLAAALQAEAQSLPNVTWHGRVLYEDALRLSAQADALLALYDPRVPNHRYASPNKVFEAMMLGKPVVTTQGTSIDQLVQQWQCGLAVPYGDEAALENALATLAAAPETRRRLGRHARRAYETAYAWPKMAQRLVALYERIMKS